MLEWSLAHWPAAALALLPALLNLLIVGYVVSRLPRTPTTYTFALFVGALATWQVSEGLMRLSGSAGTAAFWANLLALGALAIGPLALHFALLFSGRYDLARSPLFLLALYGPMVALEVVSRAGLNTSRQYENAFWGWSTTTPAPWVGRLTGFWVAALALLMTVVILRYARSLKRDDPGRRPALLVAGGFALPTLQGAVTQVVFPTLLGLPSIPIASTVMTLFSVLTLVALRQHRFLLDPTAAEDRARRAERRLAMQNKLLAEAERTARLGSWEWDVSTGRVDWSEEMFRIYGHEPHSFAVTFEKAMSPVLPEDAATIRAGLERDFQAARKAFDGSGAREYQTPGVDYRIQLSDGRQRALRGEGRVLLGPNGTPQRLVGTVQDVTERYAADEGRRLAFEREQEILRLKEMSEFKTRFINVAAHELNTPLTPIRLQAHLLKAIHGKELSAEARGGLDIVERNVDRMSRLVQDILDATRLQAGKLRIDRRKLDLNGAVQESTDSFSEPALRAGVAVDVRLEPNLTIPADPARITQVLYNLLTNAIKFTPTGGRVLVETHADHGWAILRVSDNGIGIPPAEIPRLFQPFVQLENGRKHTGHGTGLGLYITKGIVEDHGGRIECASEGPGRGTAFTIELPLAPLGDGEPEAPPPRTISGHERRGLEMEQRIRELL